MDCEELQTEIERREEADGTTRQGALRDLLTDLRVVSDTMGLDFDMAIEGSLDVYNEEKEE